MKRVLGALILTFGVLQFGWIFYNLFIHAMPATQGRSPLVPTLVAIALVYVGYKWMRGERKAHSTD